MQIRTRSSRASRLLAFSRSIGAEISKWSRSRRRRKREFDTLLETVLLQADILDLKASPTRRVRALCLEAKLDKGRGSVATALVQQGTLKVGDPFIVGQFHGKVRAMFSDRGEPVTEAPPATPVEVLGLQGVPQAGDTFQVVSDIDRAQTIANQRQQHARQAAMIKTTKRGIESLGQAEVKELLVILKADVQGSVEVVRATLEKLSTEKVKVRVIRAGAGDRRIGRALFRHLADNASTYRWITDQCLQSRAADLARLEDDNCLHSIFTRSRKRSGYRRSECRRDREGGHSRRLAERFQGLVSARSGCRVTDGLFAGWKARSSATVSSA